jgi:hypothetical protein
MPLLLDAHCNHRAHVATVDRINRDGHRLAYRDQAARRDRAEQDATRPVFRQRGLMLLQGLRRLRLA